MHAGSLRKMTYDHWKGTNPADEELGSTMEDRPRRCRSWHSEGKFAMALLGDFTLKPDSKPLGDLLDGVTFDIKPLVNEQLADLFDKEPPCLTVMSRGSFRNPGDYEAFTDPATFVLYLPNEISWHVHLVDVIASSFVTPDHEIEQVEEAKALAKRLREIADMLDGPPDALIAIAAAFDDKG
jgi:hypothetical protein